MEDIAALIDGNVAPPNKRLILEKGGCLTLLLKAFQFLLAVALWVFATLILTFLLTGMFGGFLRFSGMFHHVHVPTFHVVRQILGGLAVFAFPLLALAATISAGVVAVGWFGCEAAFQRFRAHSRGSPPNTN